MEMIKRVMFAVVSLPLAIIDLIFGVIDLFGTAFRHYGLDTICKMARWLSKDEEYEEDLERRFSDLKQSLTGKYDYQRDYALKRLQ